MTHFVLSHNKNGSYSGSVHQSISINSSVDKAWDVLSNFVGLTEWVVDVKKTEFLSKSKSGIGTARKITFADKTEVVEYAVGWKEKEYLSYIATSGLPLGGYHATLSITPKNKGIQISWDSFLISNNSNKKQFEEFATFLELFYANSLKNLKVKLEKTS